MNLLNSSSPHSISNEELLKMKHKLEDNVKEFFVLLSVSEIREIELSIAILLDTIGKTDDDLNKTSIMLKVSLLRSYHTLRLNGERQYKKVKRWLNYFPPLTDSIIGFSIVPNALEIDLLPSEGKVFEIVKKYSS